MLFQTLLFTTLAALSVSAQTTDSSCAAGKIIGIFGVCGTNATDCGSGSCCQSGSKCVTSTSSDLGFACEISSLAIDTKASSNTTLTISAGCYDVVDRKTTASSTGSSSTATATGGSTSSSGSAKASSNTASSSLSKGAIAGIVVGSVAGLFILLAAAFLLWRRSNNNRGASGLAASKDAGGLSEESVNNLPEKPAAAAFPARSGGNIEGPESAEMIKS